MTDCGYVGFKPDQKAALAKDLDEKRVKTREGRGKKFDYLETWDIEDRANQIFGFDGWSCETLELVETWTGKRETRNGTVEAIAFRARVRVTVWAGDRAVIKEAWGYGDGSGRDLGEASELAVKESESDAEKRAFKKFGWQFGLALYDKSQEHVRAGTDDEPLTTEAPQDTAPPPPPSAPQKQTATKPRREERPDPGAPKVKKFPPPEIPDGAAKVRREEIYRSWSTQIAGAVRAAPDEANARAMLKANLLTLNEMQKSIGFDAVAWVTDLIERRWPPVADEAPQADADGDQTADVGDEGLEIPPPERDDDEAVNEWDDWLDEVKSAIEASPDIASARDVIAANEKHFPTASRVLEIDVALWAQTKLEAKFGAKNKRSR